MTNMGAKVGDMILGIIGAVLLFAVGISMGETVSTYMGYINATSMANVSMGSILVLIAGYGTLFYYLGLVLGALLTFWAVTSTMGAKGKK